MKSKLFSRTMATIALGALCVGGTTVFAENLVTKLVPDTDKPAASAGTTDLPVTGPIQFDLQAGWDLQLPQLALGMARSEAATAMAVAQTAAAQASIAAAEQAKAAALAAAATPAPTPTPAPAAKKAVTKPTPSASPAKIMAAAKAKSAPAAAAEPAPAATTMAANGQAVQDAQGKSYSYSKVLSITASAYSDAPEENGGYGAVDYYGNALKLGTIAVDPKVIPLGSTVLIKGYSFSGLPETLVAKATDIGGAIKGNRVDIFIPGSRSYVSSFGIQKVQVYVLN